MQVGLRHFGWRTLEWLAGALRAGGRSRHALCREPVERTGWRNARGGPVIPAAAKALPALAERVGEGLPEVRAAPDPYAAPAVPAGDVPGTAVALPLGELGPVRPGARRPLPAPRRPVGALAGAYDGMEMDWAERESGSTGARATPTGGCGGASLAWAGHGWTAWAGSCR